jgi:hypothetical protein
LPWTEASFPKLRFDYGDAAAADFDGDGDIDLAFAIHLRGLVVLLGDGGGRFRTAATFFDRIGRPGFFASRAIEATDLDNDGRPDVAALGEGPLPMVGGRSGSYGIVALFHRDGKWRRTEITGPDSRLFGDSLVAADFDGDGRTDLATASRSLSNRRFVLWGVGSHRWEVAEIVAAREKAYVHAVAAADFDGDGDDDLALTFTQLEEPGSINGLDLLYSVGGRRWGRRELWTTSREGRPTALGTGDLDGDGEADLVALTRRGGLVVFLSKKGSFHRVHGTALESSDDGCPGYHVRLADLDGNGRDEIIAGFAGEPDSTGRTCASGGAIRAWTWSGSRPHP